MRDRLLLITNRKSYTGFQLALKSMTLYDPEHQNKGFSNLLGDFRLQDTLQEQHPAELCQNHYR